MFKNEGGWIKGRLNNVKKKTDDLVLEGVPIKSNEFGILIKKESVQV